MAEPSSNKSNAIVTRLRKKRDLETTMKTLKQLLEPLPITSKKGSRKKNKPRSLAVKAISNKSISRPKNCSVDEGEYYPNKLKRTLQMNKTVLRPRQKLKVVVTTNKRKRCTPHKGQESLSEESSPCRFGHEPPPDLNVHIAPNKVNVHTASNKVNVHTAPNKVNVHTASDKVNIHTASDKINVHTAPDKVIVHTTPNKVNIHTASDKVNIHTSSDKVNVHTASNKVNVHTASDKVNVHTKTGNLYVHTAIDNMNSQTVPSNLNTTTDIQLHTPPHSNPGMIKYNLISPPHKSLTQMTVDDLIRMDEDSLSDDDLMEILTCPSPVWWEDPHECQGMVGYCRLSVRRDVALVKYMVRVLRGELHQPAVLAALRLRAPNDYLGARRRPALLEVPNCALYLTKTAKDSTTISKNCEKRIIEVNNSSNKGSMKITSTVSVNKNKAKKIAKLENILGHIKSLVQNDDKLFVHSSEILKDNDDSNNSNDNLHRATVSDNNVKEHTLDTKEYDNDKIKSETRTDDPDISKRRKISSSGSEISVNEDDLLKNLECINIPIEKLDTDRKESDIQKIYLNVKDEKITIEIDNGVIPSDDTEINRHKCDKVEHKLPQNKSIEVKKEAAQNKSTDNKTKESDRVLDSNKETSNPKNKEEIAAELKHKSILNKLKQNDDILDVRLIKTPTNVTNEVKIWSKLDNFKRHNFKPQDFISEVIDVEDELAFSVIESKNSVEKERDPLELKNETILIDDDSNDALDQNTKPTMNIIDLDVMEPFSDVTLTAITENYETSHAEIIETDDSKNISRLAPVDDQNAAKEDTVPTDNIFGIRLVKTSDILVPKTRRKQKRAVLQTPRKQYFNRLNKKNTEIRGVKILPMETKEATQQPLIIRPTEYKSNFHVNENSKSNEDLITIDSSDTTDILCLSDEDVSLMSPSLKSDKTSEAIVMDENPSKNNDFCITSVDETDIEGTAMAPMLLATLTKNLTKSTFESPKSVKSTNSESTVEYSEGTISDTNIQFLDEYEENKTVNEEYLEIISQGTSEKHDVDDNICANTEENEDDKTVQENEDDIIVASKDENIGSNEDNNISMDNLEQTSINEKGSIDDENAEAKSIKLQDAENQEKNMNQDELITVYQILSSNTEIDKKVNETCIDNQ